MLSDVHLGLYHGTYSTDKRVRCKDGWCISDQGRVREDARGPAAGGVGEAGPEEERQRSSLPSGSIHGNFLVVMQSSVPPWMQEDQSNEEAKGPEVDSTPFQLFSGETMLNGCLHV